MHTRNIFKDSPPDFQLLGEKFVEFKPYVQKSSSGSKAYVNFKDPASLRALSTVLLKKYFGICIDIPLDRLIPTIPLRLNYIHWIEDLLLVQKKDGGSDNGTQICGIDIGCGASCVYALLGHKMNKWKFTCTEIDHDSFSYALNNVKMNNAPDEINVVLSKPNTTILKHLFESREDNLTTTTKTTPTTTTALLTHYYDFCMCNPPFFSELHYDEEQLNTTKKNRTNHRPPPPSVCTASENESLTHGGEVEFVRNMITESTELRQKIYWYTTMLGKKSSIKPLIKYLKESKVVNFTTTEFKQGRTTRWGLAWSFNEDSRANTLPQKISHKKKAKPFYLDLTTRFFNEYSIPTILPNMPWKQVTSILWEIAQVVHKQFVELLLVVENPQHVTISNKDAYEITGKAFQNTWIHHRQKRRKKHLQKTISVAASSGTLATTDINTTTTSSIIPSLDPNIGVSAATTATTATAATTNYCSTDTLMVSESNGIVNSNPIVSSFSEHSDFVESLQGKSNSEVISICSNDSREQLKRKLDSSTDVSSKRLKPSDRNLDNVNVTDAVAANESPENCLFTFSCTVGVAKQFYVTGRLDDPIISLLCLEGNRELFHQMVLYLKNVLHCLQMTNMK